MVGGGSFRFEPDVTGTPSLINRSKTGLAAGNTQLRATIRGQIMESSRNKSDKCGVISLIAKAP